MATWNPARAAWETGGGSLLCEHLVPYSETWPASGSMRSGRSFARRRSALLTSVSGSSSSPGLPTPRARDARGKGYEDGLPNVVQLLPTPTVSEANGIGHTADGGMNLRHTISLLPTPQASENENRQTKRTPSQEAGTHGKCREDGTPYGSGYGITLTDATTLLPTPRATDGTKGGPNQRGSKGDLMLPSAVNHMSNGASTSPPSDAGNTSSDDQRHDQPTLWDA